MSFCFVDEVVDETFEMGRFVDFTCETCLGVQQHVGDMLSGEVSSTADRQQQVPFGPHEV